MYGKNNMVVVLRARGKISTRPFVFFADTRSFKSQYRRSHTVKTGPTNSPSRLIENDCVTTRYDVFTVSLLGSLVSTARELLLLFQLPAFVALRPTAVFAHLSHRPLPLLAPLSVFVCVGSFARNCHIRSFVRVLIKANLFQ